MRKLKLMSMSLVLMLSLISPLTVYATEVTDEILSEETEDPGIEETEEAEDVTEKAAETTDNIITDTTKDEKYSAQVSFEALMPDGFNLGCICEIRNVTTNDVYRLIATATNKHKATIYVEPGEYIVDTLHVDGDENNTYPLAIISGFTVEKDGMAKVETTLLNYDEVKEEADRRLGLVSDTIDEEAVEVVEEKRDSVLPWKMFDVEDGAGRITIEGESTITGELVVEITKGGSNKEAEYRYSLDGGQTFSELLIANNKTALYPLRNDGSLDIDTTYDNSIGLSLVFEDGQDYIRGDIYRYPLCYEYAVKNGSNVNIGKGQIRVTSSEPLKYENDLDIYIKVVKSGKLGEAEMKYSLNGDFNYSDSVIMPAGDDNHLSTFNIDLVSSNKKVGTQRIEITLYDGDGDFAVGDTFNIPISVTIVNKDYTPYLITFAVILITLLFIACLYFRNNLIKENKDYTLESGK